MSKVKLWYCPKDDIFVIVEGDNCYKYTSKPWTALAASVIHKKDALQFFNNWYKAKVRPSKKQGFEYLGAL